MRSPFTTAVVILFSLVVSAAGQTPAAEPVTLIKAARLIDGRGGAPLAPAMVRIQSPRASLAENKAGVGQHTFLMSNARFLF